MTLKQIARGTVLIGFINVMRVLVQMFSVPLLARLLTPVDYGLAAMAMPIVLLLMMIADAGLGNSLVRTGDVDGPAWHTCFWLSAILGSLASLAVASLSPIAARLLGDPRLGIIIVSLAAIIPFQTLTVVPGAALQKNGRFGTIAASEIAALCGSIGTAVACALQGLGVWSLVWQQIIFYAIRFALTLTCSPYRPRLIFDLHDAWEHVIFGRNLLGASLISSASRSLENLLIGRVYGPGPTGVYSMAIQLARLPMMLVTGPMQYALYPHVAAIREDTERLKLLFLLLTRLLAMGFFPAVGLVAMASEPVFHVLLSDKWSRAAPIFVLIAPAAALQSVTGILGTFVIAMGRTDVQMRLAAQFAVVWLVGLMLSVWYGVAAVAGAYSVCAVLFSLFQSLRIGLPLLGCSIGIYARAVLWPAMLAVLAMLMYRTLSAPGIDHETTNLLMAFGLAILSSGAALIIQRRHLWAAFASPLTIS